MATFLGCSRLHQRLIIRCVLAISLVAVVLYLGGSWPPLVSAEQAAGLRLPRRGLKGVQEQFHVEASAKQQSSEKEAAITSHVDKPSASGTEREHSEIDTEPGKEWKDALHRIDTLLGDELRLKGLLAPITDTGEPLLRDLTHRVRAFSEMFKTWETLHFVPSGDSLRQLPVIPRLRAMKSTSYSAANAIRSYDEFRHFINVFAKKLFPWTMLSHPDHMSLHASFYSGGRGIVMTAGNDQAELLLTVIPSMRHLGCELPIEVLYLGDRDLKEELRDDLEKLPGVITRDLKLMIDDDGWQLQGWAAKAFAMLMSSFREVIFIDADSFFFVDPTTLFDDEGYRSTGALFFKDRNLMPENKRSWIKSILPSPISENVKQNRMWTGESGHMQESGVLVIDKGRHFVPLLLTTRLNGPERDSDEAKGKKGVYDMMYGDKESFWLSWEMAGDVDYVFHSGVAGTMGQLTSTRPMDLNAASPPEAAEPVEGPMICSRQLIHFDREGKPLWFNGWLSKNKDDLRDWQKFDVYLQEPKETGKRRRTDSWSIHAANVVCLEAAETKSFTSQEEATLDAILKLAKATSDTLDGK